MMTQKIVFDACFDSGSFPGPLAGRTAVVGESWVGPHGLLNILETALGLAGPVASRAERAAGLIPAMKACSGFWSASCAVDPLGAAEALLHRRDALCIQGWQGEGTGRLAELAKVTAGVTAGMPDRLRAVIEALPEREPGIGEITRLLPVDDLPALWRQVFKGLQERGVRITDRAPVAVDAGGNLGAARLAGFSPDPADASLQLLRTAGPLEAAERVAAYLAGQKDLSGTVVIGADSVLDAALRRYNLPTTGARLEKGGNALLEILPLVLACGWNPPDPRRVIELLSLTSPIRRMLAVRLADALHTWPAVGSEAWEQAWAEGAAAVDDEDARKRCAMRFEVIFSPAARHGEHYPLEAIRQRVAMLLEWMQVRRSVDRESRPDLWDAAIAQCTVFKRLVEFSGLSEFPETLMGRLLGKATEEVSATFAYPAEAGLTHIEDPGSIAGPVGKVVWWSFTRNSVRAPERSFLSAAETAILKAKGIVVPDPGNLELAAAERWRRPFQLTRSCLVLVCPRRDYDGAALVPHPLWDEITGHMKDGGQAALLEQAELRSRTLLKKVRRSKRDLPVPLHDWTVKTAIPGRASESSSGAGNLLGCPLLWVLKYACGIHSGSTASLPGDSTLWGSLVHHVIEQVIVLKPVNAGEAAEAAGKIFDEQGPRLAACLYLPGGDGDRIAVRETAVKAVRRLWELVFTGKTRVLGSEQNREGKGLGTTINGTIDLVVDSPPRVVDFKLSGEKYRRKSLEEGSAYQLAMYGRLVAGGGKPACPAAYYILDRQTLLTTEPAAFPTAEVVQGPSMEETWTLFEESYLTRISQLAKGIVTAEGVPSGGDPVELAMKIEAPCQFCEYGGICGVVEGVQ